MLAKGQAYPTVFKPLRGLLSQAFLCEERDVPAVDLAVQTGWLVASLGLLQTKLVRADLPAILEIGPGQRLALGGSSSEAGPGSC
jgi:hypothetical protein